MHNNYQVFVSSGGGDGPQEVGLRRPGGGNSAVFKFGGLLSLLNINLIKQDKPITKV